MATNFLQFNPGAANQETDAGYTADSQRVNGAINGQIFNDQLANKLFYQVTTMVAALAQALSNKGLSMLDSNYSALVSQLSNLVTFSDLANNLTVVSYSPTPALNAAVSNGFQITLAGNISGGTITGVTSGQVVAFILTQDATGGRTINWPSFVTGFNVQPDPIANSTSLMLFKADSAGNLRPIGILTSDSSNSFAENLITATLTLNSPGSAGEVLTNVGGSFVPRPISSPNISVNDLTGSRSLGTTFQNTSGVPMRVNVVAFHGADSEGQLVAFIGPTSSPALLVSQVSVTPTTTAPAWMTATFDVPIGYWYLVQAGGAGATLQNWIETTPNS
jgi:hypothetical protein